MEHKKMSKEEFAEYVKSHILEYLPQSYAGSRIYLNGTLKNNGNHKAGIVVAKPDEKVSPCIYLDSYYNMLSDAELDDIMKLIAKIRVKTETTCHEMEENTPELFDHGLMEWDNVKERIFPRVVNTERNQEYLAEHPSREKADLSMHYRILVSANNEGTSTIGVTNDLMEKWGVTEEELFQAAQENEHNFYPSMVKTIGDIVASLGAELPDECQGMPTKYNMYVITNSINQNGATAMFSDEPFAKLSAYLNTDLYILPSSIHEVIAVSTEGWWNPETLAMMVRQVNAESVAPEEQLSDHVYSYDREQHELKIADEGNDLKQTAEQETEQENNNTIYHRRGGR